MHRSSIALVLLLCGCIRGGYSWPPDGPEPLVGSADAQLDARVVDAGVDAAVDAPRPTPCGAISPDAAPGATGRTPLRASKVATSDTHACAIDLQGKLWCWGANCWGQLGQGDQIPRAVATEVPLARTIVDVAAGDGFSCAIDDQAALRCWGRNDHGQLGSGDAAERALAPTAPLSGGSGAGWSRVAAASTAACAIDSAQALWCWGSNHEGQLAQPDPWPGPGLDRRTPVQVGTASWRAVARAEGHTCGIQSNRTLWCWGRNSSGELGLGASASGQARSPQQVGGAIAWVAIAAGAAGTCGRKDSGAVYCWGDDVQGGLGFGDEAVRWAPTELGGGPWDQVVIEMFHGCGLRDGGQLWCWGRAIEGQLGFPQLEPQLTPVQTGSELGAIKSVVVGRFTTFVIDANDTLYGSGTNGGLLGNGETARPHAFKPVVR